VSPKTDEVDNIPHVRMQVDVLVELQLMAHFDHSFVTGANDFASMDDIIAELGMTGSILFDRFAPKSRTQPDTKTTMSSGSVYRGCAYAKTQLARSAIVPTAMKLSATRKSSRESLWRISRMTPTETNRKHQKTIGTLCQ
jgi:hypothetical protein